MLRRRYYPEEEAAGETEGRKEANAADWKRGDTAEGFSERAEAG